VLSQIPTLGGEVTVPEAGEVEAQLTGAGATLGGDVEAATSCALDMPLPQL
jgi:hypothetical protein